MTTENLIKETLEVVQIAFNSAFIVYLANLETMTSEESVKAFNACCRATKKHLESLLPLDGDMLEMLVKVVASKAMDIKLVA